ncbi:glycosyltransferase family 2 protein [Rhodobacteraceae bacterium]|nr:glycosyltransferase family 2 protein [Paracoccaceae bacterium]
MTKHTIYKDPLDGLTLQEACKLIRRSKQVHPKWYMETYPDVADTELEPAVHYLKYGAAMGRDPGKGFNTQFYLETYPDVAKSGINPLLHYARYGAERGYARKAAATASVMQSFKRVRLIRDKLTVLGFTDRPLAELTELVTNSTQDADRAYAARELALWEMRLKTPQGYQKAREYLDVAYTTAPTLEFRRQVTTAKLLCNYFMADFAAGRACFENASLQGEINPDVLLAWVNYHDDPQQRCGWINRMLGHYDIAPVSLTAHGDTVYDRLEVQERLTPVTDGPKVTVLLAAYEAAQMIPTALRSLQEQTWKNLEILVIDDCSPDTTCEVVSQFAARDPRIKLIRMPQNGGAYVARNYGLDQASGDFVTIHDADDWSHPKKIEIQMRYLLENPSRLGCTSEQARASEELRFTKIRGNSGIILFNTSSFLFQKGPIRERLGYWDTARFGADNELIRRMQAEFGKLSFARISTGPVSFQREALSSVTEDPIKGVQGFYYGVRQEYYAAQLHNHETAPSLRYDGDPHGSAFPRPAMMHSQGRRKTSETEHYDVIFADDFRKYTSHIAAMIARIKAFGEANQKVGIVYYYDYDLQTGTLRPCSELREVLKSGQIEVLVFGDLSTCDLLVGIDVTDPAQIQRYTPQVTLSPTGQFEPRES